jgi:hypothetical protein
MYILVMVAFTKMKIGGIPLVYRVSEGMSWKGGNSFQKFQDFDRNKKYDVIVIGSSHAYRGYDPRLFNQEHIELFNLGTSGQSLFNTYFILKNYVSSSNCRLLILDIYDGALASDGFESASDLLQNISSDKAAFEMGTALKDPRSLNMLTVRMLNSSATPLYLDSFYIGNGYSEKKDSVKKIGEREYNKSMKISEVQLKYLKKIMKFLKTHKIRTVAISHPLPLKSGRENHKKITEVVNPILSENEIEYLDHSFSHELDSDFDFYDSHHLNQSGVEKFNTTIINELKRKGYLTW